MSFRVILYVICVQISITASQSQDIRSMIGTAYADAGELSSPPFNPSSGQGGAGILHNGDHLTTLGMITEFNYEFPRAKEKVYQNQRRRQTLAKVMQNEGIHYEDTHSSAFQTAWLDIVGCQTESNITCNPYAPFRTIDGTCNNLLDPELGMSFIPQRRFVPPDYDDGFDSPRTKSVKGGYLPSPRLISNVIFKQKRLNFDDRNTLMIMSLGQFVEHDVIFTPTDSNDENGNPITCCNLTKVERPPQCFPIMLPSFDAFFSKTCMEFVRSSPVMPDACKPGPREQINQLTSYIDGSNVYGSTMEEMNNLREFRDGLMKTSEGNLPPPRDPTSCTLTANTDFCFLAGDRRVMEVPTLAALHVTFLRFHNSIAKKLKHLNPHWGDERIFQEARKINGAIQQKITYDEYLPAVLNRKTRYEHCLISRCQKYDPTVDPASRNSFSTAAFRFGHSQIAPFVAFLKRFSNSRKKCNRFTTNKTPLEETFNNPNLVIKNVDGLQYFQATNASLLFNEKERLYDDSVRNKLFLDENNDSMDLAALDIQRGRDHGIPSYNKFRQFCGLPKVYGFWNRYGGFVDHDYKTVRRLRKVYKHVDDVELFVGAQTELPLRGSLLGPTFSCIMAKQYELYKIGDRFWWERHHPITGFTYAQRCALRRMRFSKILCDEHDIPAIQPRVFFLPSHFGNRIFPCWRLPALDLRPWRENNYG